MSRTPAPRGLIYAGVVATLLVLLALYAIVARGDPVGYVALIALALFVGAPALFVYLARRDARERPDEEDEADEADEAQDD